MRNWIAGAMTLLGTLLVLGGAVTVILRAWWPAANAGGGVPGGARPGDAVSGGAAPEGAGPAAPAASGWPLTGPTAAQTPTAPAGPDPTGQDPAAPGWPARAAGPFGRLDAPERLIAWGIVLLVLAAIAAGAIGFDLGANAPVR
jgi:hypothetical protein